MSADPLTRFPDGFSAEQTPKAPLRNLSSSEKITAHPLADLAREWDDKDQFFTNREMRRVPALVVRTV